MLFVRTLSSLILVLSSSVLFAKPDCTKHRVYCAIVELRPTIDKDKAMLLSNYIYKFSTKYDTDPLRSVAIAMQESTIRNIHRKQDVVMILESCNDRGECVEYSQLATGYTDIGLWQFHARTIQAYSMDALRLRDDLEYATEQHVLLLRAKLRECADLGKDAWVCYHSRTPEYRNKYKKMVDRYYNRINQENQ